MYMTRDQYISVRNKLSRSLSCLKANFFKTSNVKSNLLLFTFNSTVDVKDSKNIEKVS